MVCSSANEMRTSLEPVRIPKRQLRKEWVVRMTQTLINGAERSTCRDNGEW